MKKALLAFVILAAVALAFAQQGNQVIPGSGGGGGVTGSGTTGVIPKWTGTGAIGNSQCDDGNTVSGYVTCNELNIKTSINSVTISNSIFDGVPTPYASFIGIVSCSTTAGTFLVVSDSTTTTLGATISSGGGTNKVLAFCNGTNWVVAAAASPNLTGSITPQSIDCHTACSPTAAQLSNAIVTNDGQGAADIRITGPTVIAGMNFIMTVETAQASNYWRYTSTTANIYLDGSATAVTSIIFTAPAVGNSFACVSSPNAVYLSCTTRNGTSSWS